MNERVLLAVAVVVVMVAIYFVPERDVQDDVITVGGPASDDIAAFCINPIPALICSQPEIDDMPIGWGHSSMYDGCNLTTVSCANSTVTETWYSEAC